MHAIADQKLVKKKGNILYEESFLKSSFQILDLKKTYSVCLQFTCIFALSVLNHFLSFIQDDSLVNFGLKDCARKILNRNYSRRGDRGGVGRGRGRGIPSDYSRTEGIQNSV